MDIYLLAISLHLLSTCYGMFPEQVLYP